METRICDRCGQPLTAGEVRYIAQIRVFAAYDPLEITFDDLKRDYGKELQQVVEQCRSMSEDELLRSVYVEFHYDLCPACQKEYIKDPLPLAGA